MDPDILFVRFEQFRRLYGCQPLLPSRAGTVPNSPFPAGFLFLVSRPSADFPTTTPKPRLPSPFSRLNHRCRLPYDRSQ